MISTLRRLLPDVRPFRPAIALAFGAAMLEAIVLASMLPLIEAAADDRSDLELPFGPMAVQLETTALATIVVTSVLMLTLCSVAASMFLARAHVRELDIQRERLVRSWLGADAEVTHAELPGRLMELLTFVTQRTLALTSVAALIGSLGTMAIFVAAAFLVDPAAAVAIVVIGVFLAAFLTPIRGYQRRLGARRAELNVELTELVGQMVEHLDDIGRHGVAHHTLADYRRRDQNALQVIGRGRALLGAIGPIYRGVGMLVVIGAILLARAASDIDTTTFGASAILLYRSLSVGQRVQNDLAVIADATGSIDALDEAVGTYDWRATSWGSDELEQVRTISVDAVHYRYPSAVRDDVALRGVSLDLRHGEVVGLAGPSGGGKSTLAALLVGTRTPQSGTIEVNGKPRSSYTEASWTARIALVPQTTRIIEATVAENIRYHRPTISDDDVRDAAIAAGVHDQIDALPLGYATRIGPSTRSLSGGQIQRIGIARALAGRPDVLVLDEPTSALDDTSEEVVSETISTLRGRVLAVVIAHRPRTLAVCDRVIHLRDGALDDAVISLEDERRSPADVTTRSA